jgi:hypothetical protein
MKSLPEKSPVVIGGVGGSGTRVVAELVHQMGFFMGNNLNASNDNMTLAEHFPEIRRLILAGSPGTKDHIQDVIKQFGIKMQADMRRAGYQEWGWKLPSSSRIIEYYHDLFPGLRLIHTIRNGLDIAFSSNQNQTKKWGSFFDIDYRKMPMPKASLQYWIRANNYAIEKGRELLGDRFLLLNFDQLCNDPVTTVARIADFIGVDSYPEDIALLVKTPDSIGRYRGSDCSCFDASDYQAVRDLGFDIQADI